MRSRTGRGVVWAVAVLVSAAGVWISWKLTLKHLSAYLPPEQQQGWLDRACTATEKTNCTKVIESRWGRFPFREPKKAEAAAEGKEAAAEKDASIPTAELGLFYFTFVLCWLVLIGTADPGRAWVHALFTALTALGLASSAFFAYVMWTKLEFWCPLCTGVHAVSLVLFVSALLLWPRRPMGRRQATAPEEEIKGTVPIPTDVGTDTKWGQSPAASTSLFGPAPAAVSAEVATAREPWPDWRTLLVMPLVALIAMSAEIAHFKSIGEHAKADNASAAAKKYLKYYRQYDDDARFPFMAWYASPKIAPPVGRDDPVRGPAEARHTLVVFSDFECPICGQFEKMLNEKILPIAAKNGDMKIVFKHWPLGKACNPHATSDTHVHACQAALAAVAAQMVGGNEAFWKMHDILFARQDLLEKNLYGEWAKEIGLDVAAFERAMKSDEARERIRRDCEDGWTIGTGQSDPRTGKPIAQHALDQMRVNSTPGMFFDGQRVYTWRHAETWYLMLTGYQLEFRPPGARQAGRASQPAGGQTAPAR